MVFLSVELVEALQAESIRLYGGAPGLRDRGLLESAVAREENAAYYDPDANATVVAASLSWGLIKNHAFIDGNKRVGLAALITFLRLNDCRLTCSAQEVTTVVLKVASSEMGQDEWTAWVSSNTGAVDAAAG